MTEAISTPWKTNKSIVAKQYSLSIYCTQIYLYVIQKPL